MKCLQVILVAVVVLLVGCEGPEGPTGPKGKDGNANVHNQTWSISSWTYSSSIYSYYADIDDEIAQAMITQDIVDNGAVVVYLKIGTSGWQLLPYTIFNVSSSGNYSTRYTAIYSPGVVSIRVTDSDLTQPVDPAGRGIHYIKVVTVASLGKQSAGKINWNNYNEVKQEFDLKD